MSLGQLGGELGENLRSGLCPRHVVDRLARVERHRPDLARDLLDRGLGREQGNLGVAQPRGRTVELLGRLHR